MKSFLSLIRWNQLLLIVFIQYVMRYAVVQPLVRLYGFDLQLSAFTFFCLVLSTVCTAAAGYAINDYFDVRTDSINRPDRVVVGKHIGRRKAMLTHIVLSLAGVLLGGYVTWRAGVAHLVILFIMVAGVLWLYSFTYKRQFLIGNLIVALFVAFVPLLTLMDIPLLNQTYRQQLLDAHTNLTLVILWVLAFSGFSFLVSLSREIVRDTEDFEGDKAYGFRSIVLVLGTNAAKWAVTGIHSLLVIALGCLFWFFLAKNLEGQIDFLTFFYFLFFLIVPLVYTGWKMFLAKDGKDYHIIGRWMNAILIAGICYGFVVLYMCR
ncbi:MAG: geranylgeranylglycerol-phosphate geranylgeranyltransferase [Bacteroidales bacterium]|nr:geranylgeranylglycerol-phosphate geranylgeranyltransferase [Bacteroidales bacterium]